MTVETARFNSSGETTTHGRVFAVSAPVVGSSRTRKMLNRSVTIAIPSRQTRWQSGAWRPDHPQRDADGGKILPNVRGLSGADAATGRWPTAAIPSRMASGSKPVQWLSSSCQHFSSAGQFSQFHFGFNCGNKITSRLLSCPSNIMQSRSMPMPMPPAGGIPCSRATKKSSSNFCCSPPA